MELKATSKFFRLSAWLRQNFLQMEYYFSLNGVLPLMMSLTDDITLKFPLRCIIRKQLYNNQNPIFEPSNLYSKMMSLS